MVNTDLNERLKALKIEDFIWIIYIGIIALSLFSNTLERKYFLFHDNTSKEEYRRINIIIFIVLIVVYLYFLKSSVDDLNNLKPNDSQKKKNLTYLSFIASLLIAVSGFIFLYIALSDKDIDVELAFS